MAKNPPHLFHIDGAKWESQDYDRSVHAVHITIADGAEHLAVWAYAGSDEYLVVRYTAHVYTPVENDFWVGPLEALCLINEAIKRRDGWLAMTAEAAARKADHRLRKRTSR